MTEQAEAIKAIVNAPPVFENSEAYEVYRKEYRAAIVPALKEHIKAHQGSQEKAKQQRLY